MSLVIISLPDSWTLSYDFHVESDNDNNNNTVKTINMTEEDCIMVIFFCISFCILFSVMTESDLIHSLKNNSNGNNHMLIFILFTFSGEREARTACNGHENFTKSY